AMISAAIAGANTGNGPHALAAAVSGCGRRAADLAPPDGTVPGWLTARPGPADDTEGAPEQPAKTITASRPGRQRPRIRRGLSTWCPRRLTASPALPVRFVQTPHPRR